MSPEKEMMKEEETLFLGVNLLKYYESLTASLNESQVSISRSILSRAVRLRRGDKPVQLPDSHVMRFA